MKMFPVIKLKSAHPRPVPRNFVSLVYDKTEKQQVKIPCKLFKRKIKGIDI